jgi:hypothetical protein
MKGSPKFNHRNVHFACARVIALLVGIVCWADRKLAVARRATASNLCSNANRGIIASVGIRITKRKCITIQQLRCISDQSEV